MSHETNDQECAQYERDLSELALGVLTGRERARALAHVETCPRCAEELEELARVADVVVQTAPDVEPPVGFETRLFERMGVSDVHGPRARRWYWVPASVAAGVIALGIGLGLALTSPSAPPTTSATGAHHQQVSANLVEDGRSVGRVVAFGGTNPWLSMMLADSGAQGEVTCVVVTADGARHTVGSFEADRGYGAWIAPLHVNPSHLRRAEVVDSDGTVIATATLS